MQYTKSEPQYEIWVYWETWYRVYKYDNRGDMLINAAKFMDGTHEQCKTDAIGKDVRPTDVVMHTVEKLTEKGES